MLFIVATPHTEYRRFQRPLWHERSAKGTVLFSGMRFDDNDLLGVCSFPWQSFRQGHAILAKAWVADLRHLLYSLKGYASQSQAQCRSFTHVPYVANCTSDE
jgi:hypothetical protein